MSGAANPFGLDPDRYTACRWCEQTHPARWLCDQLAGVVDKLNHTADAINRPPSIDFPDSAIPLNDLGIGPDDRLLSHLSVMAGGTPVGGVPRATLVFSGLDHERRQLPKWVYLGADTEIHALVDLVVDRATLALNTAAAQRGDPPTPPRNGPRRRTGR